MNKRTKRLAIITGLIMLCLFTGIFSVGCNSGSVDVSLANSDFEQGEGTSIPGWSVYDYQKDYNQQNGSVVKIMSEDGNKYAHIGSYNKNDVRLMQTIKVKKNSYYKITADVKYEDVDDFAAAHEKGAGFNISTKENGEHSQSAYATSDGWIKYTTYMSTEKASSVTLCLCLGGYSAESKGFVNIDNVTITKVSKVPSGEVCFSAYKEEVDTPSTSEEKLMMFIFTVLIIGLIVYVVLLVLKTDEESHYNKRKHLVKEKPRLTSRDAIIIGIMTLVTAVMSFANLGDTSAANSDWTPKSVGEYVTVEFPEETEISRIAYSAGIPGQGSFLIQIPDQDKEDQSKTIGTIKDVTFYEWKFLDKTFTAKKVTIFVQQTGTSLNEMGFFKKAANGEYEKVDVTIVDQGYDKDLNPDKNPNKLFDEQDDVQMYRTFQNGTYFDEIYFPRTAYEHINGLSIYEWTHPPLGKTFISIGIRLFGMNPFGWRFMGTLFGVMMVPLMYLFGFKIFKERRYAFIAAFLMMFDFMRLAQTRLATIDSYSCFFVIAMYYFMYDYFSEKSYDKPFIKSLLPLFLCGIMFGLGAASKWTCLYAGAGLAILFFLAKAMELSDFLSGKVRSKRTTKSYVLHNLIPTCVACVAFFVIIPGVIYLLSYLPYMPSHPDESLWEVMMNNQKNMFNYHSGLDATHSFGSSWYSWLVDYRPIWYYSGSGAGLEAGMDSTIVSMGNPAIWWIGLICIIPCMYFAFKRREKKMLVVFVGYALQLFPWILVTRVCFIYHYFTAIPFIMFMIVYVIKVLLEDKVISKYAVLGYLIVVLLLFIMFYPALTGMIVKESYIDKWLRWFGSWDF